MEGSQQDRVSASMSRACETSRPHATCDTCDHRLFASFARSAGRQSCDPAGFAMFPHVHRWTRLRAHV